MPFLLKILNTFESQRGNVIVFTQSAVVFHTANGEELCFLQSSEDGLEGGFRNFDIRLDILDDLIAVGILIFNCGKDTNVQKSAFHLNFHKIPPFTQYYTTHSIRCQVFYEKRSSPPPEEMT